MSMRDYGVFDCGMVIDDTAWEEISRRGGYTERDNLYDLYSNSKCEVLSSFTGSALMLDEDGMPDFSCETLYDCESVYYVACCRLPSLFHRQYSTMDEVEHEIRMRLGDLLPSDFDVRGRLRYFVGVVSG